MTEHVNRDDPAGMTPEYCPGQYRIVKGREVSKKLPHVYSRGSPDKPPKCLFCPKVNPGATPDPRPDPARPETQLRNDPWPTEIDGARVGRGASGTHRALALQHIEASGAYGATNDEITVWLEQEHGIKISTNQTSSRTGELEKDGWIHTDPTGRRRKTRRGSTGRVLLAGPVPE